MDSHVGTDYTAGLYYGLLLPHSMGQSRDYPQIHSQGAYPNKPREYSWQASWFTCAPVDSRILWPAYDTPQVLSYLPSVKARARLPL